MKKVFCVYCGKENKVNEEKCVFCNRELYPKEHLWREYILSHIKDDLKGKVTDSIFSLITNFVKSHLYGTIMSLLIVVTVSTGVVKYVNSVPIKNVSEKPIVLELKSLDINNEVVESLYSINTFNRDLILGSEGFYEGKYVDYNSFSNQNKLYMTRRLKNVLTTPYNFTSCDDMKSYSEVYNMCISDEYGSWFSPEEIEYMNLYKIDINSFETAYKELWGEDKKFPKENFDMKYSMRCEYSLENNDYLCHSLMQGWPGVQYELTELIMAEQIGNTILLYDYFVYSDDFNDGTFKDKNKTQKISDIDYRSIYFSDIKRDESIISLGQIYKHTFKMNSNGTYYYVSSEPIDKI